MNSDTTSIQTGNSSVISRAAGPQAGGQRWWGLAVLLLGGFVTIFDLFVVNVAIPSMQVGLEASFSQIGFVIVGYELAFGVMLITGSRLGDRYGRRRMFIVGMAGFTLASALCGLAPTPGWLIFARVLQGLGAAVLFPQVYAAIRVGFDGDDARRAFGLLGMVLGLAAIAGQVLGGWLVHADLFGLGWRTIFLINVPIGGGAMLAARLIPESRAASAFRLDWPGAVLVSLGLSLLLVPLIEGPSRQWPSWTFMSLAAAVVTLSVFVVLERRLRARGAMPLIDMTLFVQCRFATGGLLVLLVYSTSSSFFLCFSLLMQSGFGLDPLIAGSIFAPASIGFVVASMSAPRLVARFGTAAIAAGALVYASAIGLLIAQVALAGDALIPARLIPVLVVVGAGQGFVMTPLLNLVLAFVHEAQAGMASGVISTLQQVGAALGVSIVGIFFFGRLNAGDAATSSQALYVAAFSTAMLCNLAAAMIAFLLLVALYRGEKRQARA